MRTHELTRLLCRLSIPFLALLVGCAGGSKSTSRDAATDGTLARLDGAGDVTVDTRGDASREAGADVPASGTEVGTDRPSGVDAQDASDGPSTDGGTEEERCISTTGHTTCEFFGPVLEVKPALGGPLLAAISATGDPCPSSWCLTSPDASTGCLDYRVGGSMGMMIGESCTLVVTSVDGRSATYQVQVVQTSPAVQACCGYPYPPHSGIWVTYTPNDFDVGEIIVDFTTDGGLGRAD